MPSASFDVEIPLSYGEGMVQAHQPLLDIMKERRICRQGLPHSQPSPAPIKIVSWPPRGVCWLSHAAGCGHDESSNG